MPAPAGTGKSLAAAIIAVEVIEHGGTVVFLDVENGAEEYAGRFEDILNDKAPDVSQMCGDRLRYYAWPTLRADWNADDWVAAVGHADLVVFDSSRLILSAAGLQEDSNDDYSVFVNGVLLPLSRAGITTIVLDNTGWADSDRSRGAKSKEDLNEVVYVLRVGKPFDADETGELRLKRTRTRFSGLPDEMSIVVGGGTYRAPAAVETSQKDDLGSIRPTLLMERVSRTIEDEPGLSKRSIRTAVSGKTEYVDLALELLVAEEFVRVEKSGMAHKHYSQQPFRQDRDPVTQSVTHRDPVTPPNDRDPVTPSLRRGTVAVTVQANEYSNPCVCLDGGGDLQTKIPGRCGRCNGVRQVELS